MELPVYITLIRHGESKFNAGVCKNREELINCRITDKGKEQATNIKVQEFDMLLLSPLKRAIETYVYSNIKVKDVFISKLFREYMDGTECNLLEFEENKVETRDEFQSRVTEAFEFIKQIIANNKKNSFRLGVLCHGVFIYYLLTLFNITPVVLSNCSSIQIEMINNKVTRYWIHKV